MLPLVTRTTKALSSWLGSSGALTFQADLDQVVDAEHRCAMTPSHLSAKRPAGGRPATEWARLEKSTSLTDAEKRLAVGYPAEPDLPASKLFNPSQLRDAIGRWTSDGGGDIIPVGRGPKLPPPPKPPATPQASPRPINPAANAPAVGGLPNSNPDWGVNRLEKELRDRGFSFDKTTKAPGKIFKNESTGEEIRIMEKPPRAYRNDPNEKHETDFYYRYRKSVNDPDGVAVSIPNKD